MPSKGGGPVTIDVVAGHAPVYIMSPVQTAPHLRSGRLRALGVTGEKRDPAFPDIPTLAEAGVPGWAMMNWHGLLVRAGTPRPALSTLHAEMVRILHLPEIKNRLAAEGATVVGSMPVQFAAFLKNEMATAARIVKAAGMTPSN